MPPDPRLLDLERAFDELKETVVGPVRRQVVLRAMFRVNDELGRLARGEGQLRGRLTGMQALLNAVTIEVKRGDAAKARDAFARAEEALRDLRDDLNR